jgi:hypothetical protein
MCIVLAVALLLVVAAALLSRGTWPNGAAPDPAVVLGLHEARCRLDAAWLRHQAETDALRSRRELARELDGGP